MQVLSRVLSYAVDPLGKIASNPCEGIKQLYSGNRSEIIWTDADIAELRATDQVKMSSCARQRSPTPLILQLRRGCVSETCCAFPGRTWR